MKKCQAFSALVGSRDAWKPCSRRAIRGSQFCGRHTEVAAGIMLGICVHDLLQCGDATARKPPPPQAAKPAPTPMRSAKGFRTESAGTKARPLQDCHGGHTVRNRK